MEEAKNFDEILTGEYKRMHRYTCAEASLHALLELWNLPVDIYSWASAGYLGAIGSGYTTCGLLIGSSIGIGLKCGHLLQGIPEENEETREKAIQAVNELYTEFYMKFKSTDCNGQSMSINLATEELTSIADLSEEFV